MTQASAKCVSDQNDRLHNDNTLLNCVITLLVNSCTVPSFGMDAFSGSVCKTNCQKRKNIPKI